MQITKNPPSENLHPPLQRRSETTRTKLLEAAIACFTEFGVSNTNTTMISERAKVSRGAYLHHFKSRETLVAGAVAMMVEKAQLQIESSIRNLFCEKRPKNLYIDIWKDAYPETFYAGYEMMLLARHNETLREEWSYQSQRFAEKRLAVLHTIFPAEVADAEAYPFLEGLADFFRGVKIMELVRTESQSLGVIECFVPLFEARIEELCRHINAT